jgi:hypothetical protein
MVVNIHFLHIQEVAPLPTNPLFLKNAKKSFANLCPILNNLFPEFLKGQVKMVV